jgi:hypothetical protein
MAYQYADPSPTAPGAQSPGAVAAPAYAAAPPAQYAAPYGYGYGYPPYVDPNELRTLFLTGELLCRHPMALCTASRRLNAHVMPMRPSATKKSPPNGVRVQRHKRYIMQASRRMSRSAS